MRAPATLPFLLFLLFSSLAQAQAIRCADVGGDAPRTFSLGYGPQQFLVADFDADGKADFLARVWMTRIFYGRGDGTFDAPAAVTTYMTSAVIGDVNGDGLPDIVSVENGLTKLYVNRGRRAFEQPVLLRRGESRDEVIAVADFTEDGRADILVNATDAPMQLLINDGGGAFTSKQATSATVYSPMAVGDLDHDGHLDVSANRLGGGMIIHLQGDGRGRLETRPLGLTIADYAWPVAVDLDGDRQEELVVAVNNTVLVFRDPFHAAVIPFEAGTVHYTVTVADLNRDGAADLLFSSDRPFEGEMRVLVALNDGRGNLTPQTGFAGLGPPNRTVVKAAGDFNGDGAPDLIVAAGLDFAVVLGRGDGTFRTPRVALPAGTIVLGGADFDIDGTDELIAGGSTGLFVGTRTGALAYAFDAVPADVKAWFGNEPRVGPYSSGAGTLEGDWPLAVMANDLAVTDATAAKVHVFSRDTQHHWTETRAIDTHERPIALTGVNANELAVIVRLANNCNALRIYGARGLLGEYALDCSAFASVRSADVDRDGHHDLLVAGSGQWTYCGFTCGHSYRPLLDGSVMLLRGRGDGTFGPAETVLAKMQIYGMRTGDFNGDGRLDLALSATAETGLFTGDGRGNFTPVSSPLRTPPQFFDTGDINGDGVDDLVLNEGSIVYHFGTPAGLVQSSQRYLGFGAPYIIRTSPSELPAVIYTGAPGDAGWLANACGPKRRSARH